MAFKPRHYHVTKRAYEVKCRDCGKSLLFWECAACGAKALFNLPIYGSPTRHICDKYLHPRHRLLQKPGWMAPKPEPERAALDVDELKRYECPICNKIFRCDSDLTQHIQQLKKIEDEHAEFFDTMFKSIDFSLEEEGISETHENNPATNLVESKNKDEIGITHQKIEQEGSFQKDFDAKPKNDIGFGRVVMKQRKKTSPPRVDK